MEGEAWLSPFSPPWNSWSAGAQTAPCLVSLPHPKFQTDVQSDSSSPWLETKEIKNGTLETLLSEGTLVYKIGMKGRYREEDFRDAGKMGEVKQLNPSPKDRFVKIPYPGLGSCLGGGVCLEG